MNTRVCTGKAWHIKRSSYFNQSAAAPAQCTLPLWRNGWESVLWEAPSDNCSALSDMRRGFQAFSLWLKSNYSWQNSHIRNEKWNNNKRNEIISHPLIVGFTMLWGHCRELKSRQLCLCELYFLLLLLFGFACHGNALRILTRRPYVGRVWFTQTYIPTSLRGTQV